MHFTISNSHVFNFSGTRLHGQGHRANNFSSFTIHIVVYLLNQYLLRAPCYRRNFTRQTSSLSRRLPCDSEFFVPCTVALRPWVGVFRKVGRPGDQVPSNSSNPLFSCVFYSLTDFCINCIGRGTQCVHAGSLTTKELFQREKVLKGENGVFISSTCFKCKIIIRVF